MKTIMNSYDLSLSTDQLLEMIKTHQITPEQAVELFKKANCKYDNKTTEFYLKQDIGYYHDVWEKADLNVSIIPEKLSGEILVFDYDDEIIQSLKKKLKNCNLTLVKPGDGFEKSEEHTYIINPNQLSDFQNLLESISHDPSFIIYLWSFEKSSIKNNIFDSPITNFYSVFHLTKALIEKKISELIQILYIYSEKSDEVEPQHRALSGFSKSILLENPKIVIKTISADDLSLISNIIVTEFFSYDSMEISYQKKDRRINCVYEIEPVISDSDRSEIFKENGVYLITGGAGGLGLVFAEYIAKKNKTKIVLSSRSDLSEEKRKKVDELKVTGSDIIYLKADISKQEDAAQLIAEIKSRFKSINGIIHSAGLIKDAYISNKNTDDITAVIAPKIFGTIYLDEFTKNEPLDLFILFSSISGVLGNAGQSDYAFANRFLDYFAKKREKMRSEKKRFGKTLSINWPLWEKGGMHVDAETERYLSHRFGMTLLKNDDAINAFEAGLYSKDFSQLMVLAGDKEKLRNTLNIRIEKKPDIIKANKNIEVEFKAKFLNDLLAIVSKIIKVNEKDIDGDEEITGYGFDSISLTEFSNRINEKYSLEITPAIFFEYPTLNGLMEHLSETYKNIFFNHYHENFKSVTFEEGDDNKICEAKDHDLKENKKKNRFWKKPESRKFYTEKQDIHHARNVPIAIIGMAGVMPQSEDLNAFWKHLINGDDLITEVPKDRWDWEELYGDPLKEANKTKAKWGGFLKEVDKFDPLFFGISPKEAELMDPQQRIFLEIVWKTIEDAGYKVSDLSGTKTGLFVGVASKDYAELVLENISEIEPHASTGMSHSVLANRISYLFNLNGPSEPIDTACSSSLVAIHRSVEAIQSGSCDMAIAGGINIILTPTLTIAFDKAGMLSPDGRCKTFDINANGYVRGEGAGAILLKPLQKAIADQDHIYAVILSTAENHGGRAASLTAPNPKAQAQCIIDACEKENIDPQSISYIETHGTGTGIGDPVEINGLIRAFSELYQKSGKQIPKNPHCGLGSVKTNIGHLETAAGIAGIIKVLFAMKHKKLPANLHFNELNPYIKLEGSPFYIIKDAQDWKQQQNLNGDKIPRRAGISSFGFGGANAHIILEEYVNVKTATSYEPPATSYPCYEPPATSYTCHEPPATSYTCYQPPAIIVLSAKNKERLKVYSLILSDFLDDSMSLSEAAYTLQIGREPMEERIAFLAESIEEAKNKLKQFAYNKKDITNFYQGNISKNKGKEGLITDDEDIKITAKTDFTKIEPDKLARIWVSGTNIDWKLFYKNKILNRISLPTYPFAKERYWINETFKERINDNVNDHDELSENSVELFKLTESSLKQLMSELLKLSISKIDSNESFEIYGIDSIIIKQFNQRMEELFGPLPKTLLFEYQNIHDLTGYLLKNYEQMLLDFFKLKKGKSLKKSANRLQNNLLRSKHKKIIKNDEDIAIIGISGRYPFASDLNEFWENLKQGKDCITEIPLDRWDYREFYHPDPEKSDLGYIYCKWGGFVQDIDKFDSLFFNISPQEAESIDPHERLFLETAWCTIEDAGYTRNTLKKYQVGVFAGVTSPAPSPWSVANRVSYFFNFHGPSMPVDTACSASLYAIHLACESIKKGECQVALAGGVNLYLSPDKVIQLCQAGMLSKSGRCKSFGSDADGIVPGEGVGAVLLKPKNLAIEDEDRIYAVIKGSAINHGGKTTGYTVPNPDAQADLILNALHRSEIDPRTISYIEAHGTGTILGDPVEIRGISKAFRNFTNDSQYCAIGSVKSNIGHLEAASGIAGLTKIIFQLKHKQIVPSLHAKLVNPNISIQDSPFYIQNELSEWKQPIIEVNGNKLPVPRRAGISSFGAGGANAHIILEEYEENIKPLISSEQPAIILLSAKNEERLKAYAKLLLDFIEINPSISIKDMAYTLQIGREGMSERLAVIVSDIEELKEKLDLFIKNDPRLDSDFETDSFFRGSQKSGRDKSRLLIEDEEGKEYVKSLIEKRKLSKLAHLWVLGVDINWRFLYTENKPDIISLPHYPFEYTKPVSQIYSPEQTSLKTEKQTIKNAIEEFLKNLMADILKVSVHDIDPDTLFEEYGLDSIMINRFNLRLEEKSGKSFPKTLLFEYRTLNDLADYFIKHHDELKFADSYGKSHINIGNAKRRNTFCDIAIIGLSGSYAAASDMFEYWENLKSGKDCITEIPVSRWDYHEYYDPDIEKTKEGKIYCKWGSFLEDADKFDPLFFHISPREAELMDPQERIFLQTAWGALEDAGYANKRIKDRRIGVFVGVTSNTYLLWGPETWHLGNRSIPSSLPWSIANRVSYFFNFNGPSISLDTACSASLSAIHLACESIKKGESNLALAGGVNLYLHPSKYVQLCQMRMLSLSGKCHSFGSKADGFVPGEGVGAVLLKPLTMAISDNDHIYGVIKGTSINHGGRTKGYTVPDPNAQASLIFETLQKSGINPRTISYIEAHGTGTELGDPIEIRGLTKAYRLYTKDRQYCSIGSVKSNIGHLESAAGIAGLTKILLQFKHKAIAPTLNCKSLNPKIDLEKSPFYIQQELTEWKERVTDDNSNEIIHPRRAALSGFGAGGANAHLIVEEYSEGSKEYEVSSKQYAVIVLSAQNEDRLKDYVLLMLNFIKKYPGYSIADIAYTLQVKREAMDARFAAIVSDLMELEEKLSQYLIKGVQSLPELSNVQNKLYQLADLWIKGKEVDWNELYQNQNQRPKVITLPTYPFAKERYWIPISETVSGKNGHRHVINKLHPLINSNESTFEEQSFKSILNKNEYYLKDHKIFKKHVLPGVAYLEMARAAGEIACKKLSVKKISNAIWALPIEVDDFSREVFINLIPGQNKVEYEISTFSKAKEKQIHSNGKIIYEENETAHFETIQKMALDIASIKSRMTNSISGNECYRLFSTSGLEYGESFQIIEKLFYNETEALSHLVLPLGLERTFNEYIIHPVITDGAFQTIIGLLGTHKKTTLHIPFSMGEMTLFRPLSKQCYAYAKVSESSDAAKIKKFDITMTDESGQILLEIRDFSVRSFFQPLIKSSVKYFKNEWEKSHKDILSVHENFSYPVLSFDLNATNIKELSEKINAEIILLKSAGEFPKNIICLLPDDNFPNQQQANSLYLMFYLTRALFEQQIKELIKVLFIYSGDIENPKPQYAALSGFAKTLKQENPNFIYKIVAVPDFPMVPEISSIEFQSSDDDIEIVYDKENRFVKRIKEFKPEPSISLDQLIKTNGIYLLTGGAGGLGVIFSAYLIKKAKAKIVLSGRSELTEAHIAKIKELNDLGGEVRYFQADITKREEVEKLIAAIKGEFNILNGIIHLAGVIKDAFILNKNYDDLPSVIAPKVYGTINLDEATKSENLDFFVLFSSAASIMGNIGQCDYAYANSFMDNFAGFREKLRLKNERSGKTISINWPLWQDGSMTIDEDKKSWMKEKLGLIPLSTENGLKAFETALCSNLSQLMVLEVDIPSQFDNYLDSGSPLRYARNDGLFRFSGQKNLNIELKENTEHFFKSLIANITKLPISKIRSFDPFEKYGIDSVMVMNLTRELEKYFGELSKTLFFEYQNISELSGYFINKHKDKLLATSYEPRATNYKPRATSYEPRATSHPPSIAIIGVSGRYPMARNLEEFWENLKAGKDCITEIPIDRWDYRQFYDPDKNKINEGKIYLKWGGFIDDVDKFDPLFFNISPKEAKLIDPQEKLFLETVWHTLEDSGYTRSGLSNSRVGVYVGVMWGEYQLFGSEEMLKGNMIAPRSSYASIANRASYFFNFAGPSVTLDTMCSGSLTAIHFACESILSGEIDLAVAGGVNISIHAQKYLQLSQGRFASSDGRCKSFGQGGDGYVPGEGVGAVLLKPLDKAISDGDHIYAVIRGSAINHGGKTNGYTVPNPNAQANLISSALKKANINPGTISCLEAHGTGTALGDPIEITGLMKAFDKYTKDLQYCSIGSVKSNIGHLESAAGIAGLTKVLLQFKYKQLVPSIHSDKLNPNINFKNSPFYVQKEISEWKQPVIKVNDKEYPGLRRAAISSFGAGGSNAHLILEEYQPLSTNYEPRATSHELISTSYEPRATSHELPATSHEPPATSHEPPAIILLSTKNKESLINYAGSLNDFLGKDSISLSDMAYTLQVGREPMDERLAIVSQNIYELREKLKQFINQESDTQNIYWGKIGADQSQNDLFIEGEEGEKFVRSILLSKKLDKLAKLWVSGIEIDWNLLYQDKQISPKRISLPLYPFAKERCWISKSSQSYPSAFKALHPLIDSVDLRGSLKQGLVFKKLLNKTDKIICDHQVDKFSILPGSGFMEMAYAAGNVVYGEKPFFLSRIAFLKPLSLTEDKKEIQIVIKDEKHSNAFEIQSSDGIRMITHAKGEFHEKNEHLVSDNLKISIQEIKNRCTQKLDKEAIYHQYRQNGIAYGNYFQRLESIWHNAEEALGFIVSADEYINELSHYKFHPALTDAALQTIAGLYHAKESSDNQLMVPFVIEEARILNPLKSTSYAYVKADGKNRYHVQILDENGLLCVELNDVSLKSLAADPSSQVIASETIKVKQQEIKKKISKPTVRNGKEKKQYIEEKIIESIVNSLDIRPDSIDLTKSFSEYGVDSILGIELINNINDALNIVLKTITLFDYTNVKDLTEYILTTYGDKIKTDENESENSDNDSESDVYDDEDYHDNLNNQISCQGVVLTRPTNIEKIKIQNIVPIEPADNEVQILVKAFSLNFGDLLCVQGLYPTMPEYPFTPGFEVSGTVMKTGKNVKRFIAGDNVMGLSGLKMGGNCTVVTTDERLIVKKPENITFEEACSIPVVFLTMYHVFELAGVKENENVLIQTAAGGIGLISVQLALLKGAKIFATAGSKEKLDYLNQMGVLHLINYQNEDFAEKVLELTDHYGADVVINTLSGDAIQKGINILAAGGRYVEIAMTGLKSSNLFDLSKMIDNQVFISVDLRKLISRQPEIVMQYLDIMVDYLQDGKVKPTVCKTFPFSKIKDAYLYLQDRKNIGKIVVTAPFLTQNLNLEKTLLSGQLYQPYQTASQNREIAVIGISCRFPGARNAEEFWQNLKNGKSSIIEIPKDRWDIDISAIFDPDPLKPDKTYCKWGGFVSDIDKFDPLFFSMSGKEAQETDPQQRLFIEECWNALEDAGYANKSVSGLNCAVFVGAGQGDYQSKTGAQSFLGNSNSILASRISYFLNLKGPSIAIDTACSSSLVALHLGRQSILNGESEMAIAGGVFICTTPAFHIMTSKTNMLSKDGKCKTFDDNADGFVPGEGVGAVVIKSLEKALKDGDHIYGIIKGSGINQDGKTNGITAPSSRSQTDLELSVYQKFAINPETITFVEAHGTGTKLGDPIEIEALTNAFRKYTRNSQYCAIGSVKTNIGHTATAAGIAGVIKALLSLKHKQIPPSLNYNKENEHINFKDTPFFVNTRLKEWIVPKGIPRRVAVSSFGFSGTNAHLVLEEYNYKHQPPATSHELRATNYEPRATNYAPRATSHELQAISHPPVLFLLSAKNDDRLKAYAKKMAEFFEREKILSISDISFTLQVSREHMNSRLAFIANSLDEIKEKLSGFYKGNKDNKDLWKGNARDQHGKSELSIDGKSLNEHTGLLIKGEKLSELAKLWVSGIDTDWKLMHQNKKPQKISLPTYPFARKSYWRSDKFEKPVSSKAKSKRLEIKPEPQKAACRDFYYKPCWIYSPLPAQAKLKNNDSLENRTIFIIYPHEITELKNALASFYLGNNLIEIILGKENRKHSKKVFEIETSNPESFNHLSGQFGQIHTVLFLGGIQIIQPETDDLDALLQSQEKGVLSLFRLINYLDSHNLIKSGLSLTILTNDVHQIFTNDKIIPFSGSIYGLARVFSREYRKVFVRSIDISLNDIPYDHDVEKLKNFMLPVFSEASIENHPYEEGAYRNGKRYIRIIEPIKLLPVHPQQSFKTGGVYLILGGAGGIGLELSQYLAEKYKAKLVLIGRRNLGLEQEKKIARINQQGASILYIQADANNLESMRSAIKKAKAQFGQINGAIHSAIVLKDKALYNMDEETFKLALWPKVFGSAVLYKALKDEPLDFMMFFSSVQSFTGNPGQSNYAAGSTFKDAFAFHLSQIAPYPVKIINWGYWGTVGIVSNNEYNKRLSAIGVKSLSPEEGMEAIEAVLKNRVTQIIPFKAEPALLELMGIDQNHYLEHLPDTIPSLLENLISKLSSESFHEKDSSSSNSDLGQAFTEMHQYGRHLLLAAFQSMGVFLKKDEHYDKNELKTLLHISLSHNRLFNVLTDILTDSKWIEQKGSEVITTPYLEDKTLKTELEELKDKKDKLTRKFPEIVSYLRLLQICCKNYPEILTGKIPATDVMFPNSSMELVEGVYKGNKSADSFNRLVAESVKAYINLRISSLKEGEKISIIEIGAGTGGTSVLVLNKVRSYEKQLKYVYTDISLGFIKHGKKNYGHYPFCEFSTLNIENDITEQGYLKGDYDIAIAANVLHATRNIKNTLFNVKKLLKTNGLLILNEATSVFEFSTLTFGLLPGWWLFEDEENRLKGGPLLSSRMWEQVLKEEGFDHVISLLQSKADNQSVPQDIIIGESNGELKLPKEKVNVDGDFFDDTLDEIKDELNDQAYQEKLTSDSIIDDTIDNEDKRKVITEKIIENLSIVLQIEKEEFDVDISYTEFGVDSILAVEIVNKLNENLSIDLRSTDLFNYPTIQKLTTYIADKFWIQADKPLMTLSVQNSDRINTGSKITADNLILDVIERFKDGELDINEAEKLLAQYL